MYNMTKIRILFYKTITPSILRQFNSSKFSIAERLYCVVITSPVPTLAKHPTVYKMVGIPSSAWLLNICKEK